MDDGNRVVRDVLIEDGRFVEVGNDIRGGPDTEVINLRGRTVVPGLIESHTHFVSLANRPGYHVAQLELATSIAEVLRVARRPPDLGDVPEGAFITAMGGWHPNLWAERRLPDARRARRGGARPAGHRCSSAATGRRGVNSLARRSSRP